MKESLFNKIYIAGIFIAVILPILNAPPLFSPPDWGKILIFRIVVSILIFTSTWHILLLLRKNKLAALFQTFSFKKKENIVLWLLFGLFITFLLSTLFSVDIRFSLWGDPTRAGGFIAFISYIILSILAFLILKGKSWQRLWDTAITVGVLISIVAIFQWQGWFSDIFVATARPASTLGNPIMLAMFSFILLFLSFPFGLKETKTWKKIFYFASTALFLLIILITATRAAYVAIVLSSFYFLFFYPIQKKWLSVALKGSFLIFLALIISSIYYVNTQPELPEITRTNPILRLVIPRLSLNLLSYEPRFSAWQVALEAIKEKPLLGYGPENFATAFDKYYDPALPNIEYIEKGSNSWWDRAHNTLLGTAVHTGIPSAILYFSIFGVLFWQLRLIKKRDVQNIGIIHGIQAAFIGYLTINMFSFDTFSTYILLFLLIAYSLFLIHRSSVHADKENGIYKTLPHKVPKYGKPILIILAFVFVLFNWQYSILPLQVNAKINDAEDLVKIEMCDQAFEKMDSALVQSDTFLNAYLNFRYAHILNACGQIYQDKAPEYNQKSYELLKESIKTRPTFTRSWIFLATSINIMIEQENIGILTNISPEKLEMLKQEMEHAFLKASELSPKRQEVYIEWIRADLVTGDFQVAKERAQKCIDLDVESGVCWWLKGLSEIFLNELDSAKSDIAESQKRYYKTLSVRSLRQLIRAYLYIENYSEMAESTIQLISKDPMNPQYHTALAAIYKELGEYAKATKEALIVLELQPEAQADIEAFLRTLR